MNTDLGNINILTMSTPEISQLTGIRHDNVMRSAKRLADKGIIASPQIEEMVNIGSGAIRAKKIYNLTKVESLNLVANLSPEFTAAIIDRWQELEKHPQKTALPPQYVRYLKHIANVPPRHFCAMGLVYNGFIGKLTMSGHDLLDKLMPDGSFSRLFSDSLRKDGINPQTFPTYPFVSIRGFSGQARAYPIKFYDNADKYLNDFWLPSHAPEYLASRDRGALQHLSVALSSLIALPDHHQIRLL